MQCGLLGEKLSHSYSPEIHKHFADYTYELFEIAPEGLQAFLRGDSFHGINVTIPYKKAVIPYLDGLSERAQALGSVNTIIRKNDGRLIGHNTDYFGFYSLMLRTGLCVAGKKVLVLGSGGASVTVLAVLHSLEATPVVISRSGENNYTNLSRHADASVVVNTTPVGMYPHTGVSPIDLSLFPCLEGVVDLIYNPSKTKLLLDAEQRKIPAFNGLWMLVAQAKESAEWFLGRKLPDNMIGSVYTSLQNRMKNIVLIGMPGCGKSTIGQKLALKLGREFIDSDSVIEQMADMSIPDIFSKFGEKEFRRLETQALKELGKRSSLVIATGGGCVTQEENYPLLHQNGSIIWLQRSLEKLPTDGRPLSQATSLAQMYTIRKPMYQAFADTTIHNTGSLESVADRIISQLKMEVLP